MDTQVWIRRPIWIDVSWCDIKIVTRSFYYMGKYDNVNYVRYFAFNASIRIWIFEERSEWDFQIFA